MRTATIFHEGVLEIDAEAEIERICARCRELLGGTLKRRGLVVGLSGGIDSSVTAALAARAFGEGRVLGLQMPERHSADETSDLSALLADKLGIATVREDISAILEAVGFYDRYDGAVRSVVPEYGPKWRSKIVLPNLLEHDGYSYYTIVAVSPDGERIARRLPLEAYLGVVAATNFKQRIRKMLEYYHADRLHYAVAGTPNRLEYDQGFFVKLGDGAADIKPIAHLYKSQVYALAEALGVPEEIRRRAPTTDTYSLEQGQDEFYFSLPYRQMDLCLWALNGTVPAEESAAVLGLTTEQIERVYADIERKRSTTRYLHMPPLLVEDVAEIAKQERAQPPLAATASPSPTSLQP